MKGAAFRNKPNQPKALRRAGTRPVRQSVLGLIAGFLNLITYLPILSSFNSLLGGLLGAAFALVLCTVVLWTLKLFAPAVYSDYGMLPPSEMHQSVIAGKLVGWNDGVSLFESVGTAE